MDTDCLASLAFELGNVFAEVLADEARVTPMKFSQSTGYDILWMVVDEACKGFDLGVWPVCRPLLIHFAPQQDRILLRNRFSNQLDDVLENVITDKLVWRFNDAIKGNEKK